MHSGKVQWVAKTHGFIDWRIDGEPQPRIIFNAFDVEGSAGAPGSAGKGTGVGGPGSAGNAGPVSLRPGDEVTFTIADKVRSSIRQPMKPHVPSKALQCCKTDRTGTITQP